MVETIHTEEGPSTIVLVAGDADYAPPLEKCTKKGWRTEVAFINRGVGTALVPHVHEFRSLSISAIELMSI